MPDDFTIAIVPGWHSTIFPPYFVAGAIYSGLAMVLTLAIPLRSYYHLEDPEAGVPRVIGAPGFPAKAGPKMPRPQKELPQQ